MLSATNIQMFNKYVEEYLLTYIIISQLKINLSKTIINSNLNIKGNRYY